MPRLDKENKQLNQLRTSLVLEEVCNQISA